MPRSKSRSCISLEHLLYLGAALLFWWPIIGLDPSPWRMPHPVRVMYAFLQMPQNTFLGARDLSGIEPLYPHYATLGRAWGPTVIADQQLAGGLMWIVGDLVFLVAILFDRWSSWMRQEDHGTRLRTTPVRTPSAT